VRVAGIELFRIQNQDGELVQLQGVVASDGDPEDAAWFEPFSLWYRFPVWCEPYLSVENGDPFLPPLLVLAMKTGEPLTLPAPVDARLREALPEIQDVLLSFYPRLSRVAVDTAVRTRPLPATAAGGNVGLFFSMGVDSFYSLLKNVRDHPADARTISHLISVNGFDVTYEGDDGEFPPPLLRNFQRVSDALGTTLLPVSTNIRRFGVRLTDWPMLHGAALASVALALGTLFHRVSIAASTTYDKLYPWGSHPVLDPLWSTETLGFVHDGCELNTIDKTDVVAASPLALETLRPCAGYGRGYNCGRCEKCLRTMLDLLRLDALERCPTLPDAIDPAVLRAGLRPGGPIHVADYQRRLDALRTAGRDPAVCQALEEHLALGMNPRFTAGKPPPAPTVPLRRRLAERVSRALER
jgi:hypothetical protein